MRLAAGNDIAIETAQNTHTESHSSTRKKSGAFGSGGIGFTIGSQTIGNTAEITQTTHSGSLIGSTSGRVDIVAGNDVTITGSDVLSKAGVGGGSASGYYNQSKIDSTYTSVNEQTGIQAGAGGFDITVGGHTELVGAAIASTADPDKNRLSTESLSVSDLQNQAKYKANSFGVSASSSGSSKSNLIANGIGAGMNLAVGQKESESSTTRAGISAGTIDIRSGDESALASIDRSITTLQQSGLNEIFDEQKVAERMEMGQVASQVGMTAAGDLADKMGWEEGSKEKTILHGVMGAGIAALAGGDAL